MVFPVPSAEEKCSAQCQSRQDYSIRSNRIQLHRRPIFKVPPLPVSILVSLDFAYTDLLVGNALLRWSHLVRLARVVLEFLSTKLTSKHAIVGIEYCSVASIGLDAAIWFGRPRQKPSSYHQLYGKKAQLKQMYKYHIIVLF
ncbi:hypothetical protein B6A09_0125 [Saccharomyces cerevisiae synthetic construct]|uniref:Putative uncharacterized protein YBL083C n=1 Tax=Saccharomyces cerevisiae (strain ATCC 204508 / S288c) TaxID=559292 RepID=YBI3_YEAST|nr:RecName: Full=Putative uncharacterized protein YBL083C [Saccharomyces cerevisiae S288C]ARB01700.1 hypothetical protein B6A09_0125 [Saccharomyces cerevisiae synthetic construct]WNV71798.1 hypothetical protein O6U65_0025 [Saccharomyces cerevisiae synthetic construct]CAA56023.1 F-458 protein [Saccharomyces cerevisiae]CAA84903.1 unnamed protein product [Saccharomyces cerevisiae]